MFDILWLTFSLLGLLGPSLRFLTTTGSQRRFPGRGQPSPRQRTGHSSTQQPAEKPLNVYFSSWGMQELESHALVRWEFICVLLLSHPNPAAALPVSLQLHFPPCSQPPLLFPPRRVSSLPLPSRAGPSSAPSSAHLPRAHFSLSFLLQPPLPSPLHLSSVPLPSFSFPPSQCVSLSLGRCRQLRCPFPSVSPSLSPAGSRRAAATQQELPFRSSFAAQTAGLLQRPWLANSSSSRKNKTTANSSSQLFA